MGDAVNVLITGTTSGLGRAFLDLDYKRGDEVIAVNRRSAPDLEREYPRARFPVLDISKAHAVYHFLAQLDRDWKAPGLLILNAGESIVPITSTVWITKPFTKSCKPISMAF